MKLVAKAYLAASFFVAVFVFLLVFGSKLSSSLSEPPWALLVAAALTLPALAPWLSKDVLPRLHSIKISVVEIALQVPAQAISAAAQALSSGLTDNPVLPEYAGRMTSLSASIIEAVKEVQNEGYEVLPVDLSTPWVVPNLYFLVLMLVQKTRVRQVSFVDSHLIADRFICASSPEEIISALEWQRPELREAAQTARFNQDPRSTDTSAGVEFFNQLRSIYGRTAGASTQQVAPLTPESLLWILGEAAHCNTVQWSEPAGENVYRRVLESDSPFVAAVKGRQLQFLVSREKVATAVARATLR